MNNVTEKTGSRVGSRVHIVIDDMTKEIVAVTDRFDECKEILTTLEDGEYQISTWEFTNDLAWYFSEDSSYLIRNGLVYKQKYYKQEDMFNYVD